MISFYREKKQQQQLDSIAGTWHSTQLKT